MDDQVNQEGGVSEERKEFSQILPALVAIFTDTRNCPVTLALVAKCICTLISSDLDKKNRIIIIQEGIISSAVKYLDSYDFDEKLTLCCLDIISNLLSEIKLKIVDFLYGEELNFLTKLTRFLGESRVINTYYSQRV